MVDPPFCTLKAVFVDREGVYKDINQAYFRHLVAWMNYDMWYHQVPVDFCGMRNVFVGMDYHQFVAQASADANNTPEVWVKVYAPEGMSKMTKAEEEGTHAPSVGFGNARTMSSQPIV